MKKYKWVIIIILLVSAIPLAFWWGVRHGNDIDARLIMHGTELIRLQNDIKGLQLHVAELMVENYRLRSQINKITIHQETIRIHQLR